MSAFKQRMAKLGVRAGLLAGASAAVLAISGIGASSAMAVATCPNKTLNIQGKGASLQRIAQSTWTGREVPSGEPLIEIPHKKLEPEKGYASTCKEGPTVSYTSTNNASGLDAFQFTGTGAIDHSLAFVGSDDAPNKAQIENAEAATEGGKGKPIIVPVIQTSIAVVIHPPAGCKFKAGKGITWKQLGEVFGGKSITKWSGFGANVEGGAACEKEITRVVRAEVSSATYQFKNYLAVLEEEKGGPGMPCELEGYDEEKGVTVKTKKWKNMLAAHLNGQPNITWPGPGNCEGTTPVERATSVAKIVAEKEGTIGYAALPNAKEEGAETALLQNGEVEGKPTFAAPEKKEGEEANCGERVYTVPEGGRTGEAAEAVDWSQVFGAKPQIGGAYPLCTLTYDIGWHTYEQAGYGPESAKIAEVAKDYILRHVLETNAGGGQTVAMWYAPLPSTPTEPKTDVLGAARAAAEKLG
jgi:ABC-type phosphate transport system substrate-binding protein